MSHMADYAHCSNVKSSARMMEICKRLHNSKAAASSSSASGSGTNSAGSSGDSSSAAAAAATGGSSNQTPLRNRLIAANIVPRSNGNVTLTFNHQRAVPVREARSSTYDAHTLQPGALAAVPFPMAAAAAAAANYQPLPSPANHVVVQRAPPPPPQAVAAPAAGPPMAPAQQYVPVTMVDTRNGRQMLAAVQASWPTSSRQMTLVPSWPQLSAAATGPSAPVAAAADSLLQPFIAAAASDAADWHRRPLLVDSAGAIHSLQDQAVFPAVVYGRVAAAAAAGSSRAAAAAAAAAYQGSSSGAGPSSGGSSKRSTKTSNMASGQQPPPAHSNSHCYSQYNSGGVKKEPSQLSPVKKRIKENKDHYYVSDPYHQRSSAEYRAASGRAPAITIHDTPPLAHQQQQRHLNRGAAAQPPPEIITISDSDDEACDPKAAKTSASSTQHHHVKKPEATPTKAIPSAVEESGSQNVSRGPSVMPLTPSLVIPQAYSSQSTPCASRSNLASCVTVGADSDEDYQRTPVKHEVAASSSQQPVAGPSTSAGVSAVKAETSTPLLPKKNRLLKAQSEWALSSLKEETESAVAAAGSETKYSSSGSGVGGGVGGALASSDSSPASNAAYYAPSSRNSIAVDDKELIRQAATRQHQEFLEQQQQLLRERELELHVARERKREREYAAAHAAAMATYRHEREREREAMRADPMPAHAARDYNQQVHAAAAAAAHAAAAAQSRHAVEYSIQPPAAHAAQAHTQPGHAVSAGHVPAGQPPPGHPGVPQPDPVLAVHPRDFYTAAAQPTVYV